MPLFLSPPQPDMHLLAGETCPAAEQSIGWFWAPKACFSLEQNLCSRELPSPHRHRRREDIPSIFV